MNKIDQFLYGNYICWKTGMLVFMWQIKIVTYRKLSDGRIDETTYKLEIFLMSSIDPSLTGK